MNTLDAIATDRIGPVPILTDDLLAACLKTLTQHDALDLAEMLLGSIKEITDD